MPQHYKPEGSFAAFENSQIVAPFAKEILRKTRPIYLLACGEPERNMRALGSGFLIQYLRRSFFVTASHVAIEAPKAELYVPLSEGGRLDAIGGVWRHTTLRGQPVALDKIDLAFIELPEALSSSIPSDNFFRSGDWSTIDPYHEKSHYIVCGWPAKRNQPNPHRPGRLPRNPISYLDASYPPHEFERFNVTPATHQVVHFDRKRAVGDKHNIIIPPRLSGISGSPCMFFHRYRDLDDLMTIRQPKLIGVAIEVAKDAIIATRIGLLINMISAEFGR